MGIVGEQDGTNGGCVVLIDGDRCGRPPTSGLPICGSCLRRLLDEPDPGRRRTLAGHPGLAAGVVRQLAEDPDVQVRSQVAARDDLDKATTSRLADPDRESAPPVWRSIAATRGGAALAWELLGTDDTATLAILASNPAVDPDILDHLARHHEPDVAWTASATLAGQPAGAVISKHLDEARRFDGRPLQRPAPASGPTTASGTLSGAPATTTVAAAAAADPPPPTAPRSPTVDPPVPVPRPDPPASPRRRGTPLLVGAIALVVVAVVVVVLALGRGGSDTRTSTGVPSTTGPRGRLMQTTTVARAAGTDDHPGTTANPTAAPTTPAPTLPAPTVPAPPPVVTPPPAAPITQNFTIVPTAGTFCGAVSVTVNFSPSPGYVVITDDTGAQVGGWGGASGQTQQLNLPRPTGALSVAVTAVGTGLSVSGSATGESC